LLAFAILVLYLISGKVLQGTAHGANVPLAFRAVVLNKVFWFGVVVVVAAIVIKVLPVFAFRDTRVHGVVLRKGAQTTVASAQISLDGLFGLATNSDNNGNFQITVPAYQREDDYTVRAQLGGEGGVAKVKDADAPKTSVAIELPAPADYGWTTVNVPDGWSLRTILQKLADGDKATIIYGSGCTAALLNSKVRAGELRARTTAAVMEELPRRLVRSQTFQITATKGPDGGHYEVNCSK
jgi:hypothetical protein